VKKVDVIIPTYKPTEKLNKLLKMLKVQTYPVNRVILINTEEKYFTAFAYGNKNFSFDSNVLVKHISRMEFDHGATRNYGISLSDAEYFICMTDDAVPMDEFLVENLLEPLLAGNAVVSYARQCVGKRGALIEGFTRKFNYPEESRLKTKEDIATMGIKAFFCSNVCAAYKRSVFEQLGRFDTPMIFNEDMIFASKVLNAGYAIAYQANARVRHAHRYTNLQQLKRNFDLGVSQAKYPEIFSVVSSTSEGKALVKQTIAYLKEKGKADKIPGYIITSGYKYIGYQLGKHYRMLPRKWIMKLTMNPCYWYKE